MSWMCVDQALPDSEDDVLEIGRAQV